MSTTGNHGWQRRLYEAKAAELVLYGRALGLSHGEAEDVLQDTFLALLRVEGVPEEPVHYCLRAFRHRALNFRRSFWRRVTRELESWRWFEAAEGESEQERAAMRCLALLPAEQREVIVLKIWHRHTFEEIGGLLGLSPNTVAGRYRYGMQKLRSSLRQSAADEPDLDAETGAAGRTSGPRSSAMAESEEVTRSPVFLRGSPVRCPS